MNESVKKEIVGGKGRTSQENLEIVAQVEKKERDN